MSTFPKPGQTGGTCASLRAFVAGVCLFLYTPSPLFAMCFNGFIARWQWASFSLYDLIALFVPYLPLCVCVCVSEYSGECVGGWVTRVELKSI